MPRPRPAFNFRNSVALMGYVALGSPPIVWTHPCAAANLRTAKDGKSDWQSEEPKPVAYFFQAPVENLGLENDRLETGSELRPF
eukprot:s1276_g2.t1